MEIQHSINKTAQKCGHYNCIAASEVTAPTMIPQKALHCKLS